MTDSVREMVQKLAGTYGKANVRIFDAEVISVDLTSRTCVVNSLDKSINNLTVRFMLEVSDGDMSVPEVESNISVAMTDFTEPYMVKPTWISEKLFVVGNQMFDIKNGKTVFNDGKYGGLATVLGDAGLLKKINQLEKKYNDLLNSLNLVVITLAPSGTFPINTFLTSNTLISPITSEKDISNPNITHGDKFGS